MRNPFYFETTCEIVRPHWIQQPVSAGINFVTVIALLIIAIINRSLLYKNPVLIFLFTSFIVFESWHTLSHARHAWLPKELQINITHGLFYGIIISLAVFDYSIGCMNSLNIAILAMLIVLDIFIWIKVRGTWMIVSGVLIALYLALIMIPLAPVSCYPFFILISIFILASLIFVSIEAKLCPHCKEFPVHAVTEICVFLVFVWTAILLVRWTKHKNQLKFYFESYNKNV